MSDSLLEVFFIILQENNMYETFIKWVKSEKIIPKRKWYQKRDIEKEEQQMYDAVMKFVETDIPSDKLKAEILSFK